MTIAVLAHSSRTLGHGMDWNTCEGAVYHAATRDGKRTLCGYASDAPGLFQGPSERGWDFLGEARKENV